MAFLNKIFGEDKSQELFEKNNLTHEWQTKSGDTIFPDLHLIHYLNLTREKPPKRKHITQEMIDEYKTNMEIMDNEGILTEDLSEFMIYWGNFGIFKLRNGNDEYMINEEYSNKAKESYLNKTLTPEIAKGFKIYCKNIELLDENNLRNDVDFIFRGNVNNNIEIYMFIINNELDLTEKILTNDDLIKIMELKIKKLYDDIDRYSSTSFSSRSRIEANKLQLMKIQTEIDLYERNIKKLNKK